MKSLKAFHLGLPAPFSTAPKVPLKICHFRLFLRFPSVLPRVYGDFFPFTTVQEFYFWPQIQKIIGFLQ